MQLFHFYHQNKLQRLIHSDFWLFELSVWLHTFSRSLVAIFIPILLLQIGYSIGEIILYYFIYNVIDVPWNFIARWLVRKIGARRVIILGSFFSVLFFIALFNLEINNWLLLFFIACFAAIYDTFYWVAHLYLFMKCSKHSNNFSGDASILSIVRQMAGIAAPALGALILIVFDKQVLIMVSIVILLLSIIPLFKITDIPDKPKRKQKSFKQFFKNWEISKDYVAAGFFAIHCGVEGIIWPLFIYIFFDSIKSVAVLPIIVSVTTIVFTYFAGKFTKQKRMDMIISGSALISIVWVMRIFINIGFFYYLSVFLIGLFSVLISIPLDSYIFEKGEKRDTLSASTWRNTVSMSSKALLYAVLFVMVNIFNVSFVLAALSMFSLVIFSSLLGELFFRRRKLSF